MRPLYFLLRVLLPYVMSVFYKDSKTIKGQRKFNAQTIFVSNHPSAFIDPLVAGNFQHAILYFVTRGDIFKTWLHPVTWASHMVPIFRKEQDGADSHEKNKDSFVYLRKVLLRNKSLILFGEGYTDDVFIRSLKVIKKGPARIGFDTMTESDWQKDIKIQALGINYTHPKYFRSGMLMSFGECVHLNEYKELYEENPSAAVTQLTRRIQSSLREQITYVEDKELAPFVEQILILSRKGMNHFHHDPKIPLLDRYTYSKQVANTVNEAFPIPNENWQNLKDRVTAYFEQLSTEKINENWVFDFGKKGKKGVWRTFLIFFISLPLTILGLAHQLIPYLLIKRFVESTFKRDVFWSGVKLLLGATISALYNIIFIFLFYDCIHPNYWLAFFYYITIPAITGVIAYNQIKAFGDALKYRKANESILKKMAEERQQLRETLTEMDLI